MNIITGKAKTNKTTEIIKLANNKNGTIVCCDPSAVAYTKELAEHLGADINKPICADDLRKHITAYDITKVKPNIPGPLHIDDVQITLFMLLGIDVKGMAVHHRQLEKQGAAATGKVSYSTDGIAGVCMTACPYGEKVGGPSRSTIRKVGSGQCTDCNYHIDLAPGHEQAVICQKRKEEQETSNGK